MAIEILTSNGFMPFAGVKRSTASSLVKVCFTHSSLICTLNHQLQTPSGYIEARSLKPRDRVNPNERVVSIALLEKDEYVYDPVDVFGGNHYISNGVVSHNCKFFGSSDTLISGSKLQKLTFCEPISGDEYFKVYSRPQEKGSYVITVDVSEGIGKDFSVVSVIDVTEKPFRQVAKYRSNIIPPLMLADVVYRIATMYNSGVVIVETNSVGGQVSNSLWFDYEYENMLTTKVKVAENREFGGARAEVGVRTTPKTKLVGCSQLKALIEGDTLIIQDFETVQELTTFVKNGKKFEATKNKNDDVVMSLVLFAWFTTQLNFSEMVDVNVRTLLRDNLNAQDEYQAVVGFFDDGIEAPEIHLNQGFY